MEKVILKPDYNLLEKHGFGQIPTPENYSTIEAAKASYYRRLLSEILPPDAELKQTFALAVTEEFYNLFSKAIERTGIQHLTDTLFYIGLSLSGTNQKTLDYRDGFVGKLKADAREQLRILEFCRRNKLDKDYDEAGYSGVKEIILKTPTETLKISHTGLIHYLLEGFTERMGGVDKEIQEEASLLDSKKKESTIIKTKIAKKIFSLIRDVYPDAPNDWLYHAIGVVFYISGIEVDYYGTLLNPLSPNLDRTQLNNRIKRLFS